MTARILVVCILFDRGTQHRLGIDGRRPGGFNDYIQEARSFYQTKATLAAHGLARERS